MQRILRSRKAVACTVLVVALIVAVAFAGDIIVEPGALTVDDVKIYRDTNPPYGGGHYMTLKSDTSSDPICFRWNVKVRGVLDVEDDVFVDDDLGAQTVTTIGDIWSQDDVVASDDLACSDDIFAGGKIDSSGGYDPPYVLYDQQSRAEVIDRVKMEVPPEKQGGAALFFNRETKRLETYVASEGKFYNLQGNLIYELPKVVAPVTQYETAYYLEPSTGLVKTRQKKVSYRYRVREGFEFKAKIGRFIDKRTGEEATREAALEWCVDNDNIYRDMQGNVLRVEPKEEDAEYVTEYRFDNRTGDVKVRRRAVHDRHALKEGYGLDKNTGRFVNTKTGDVVEKGQAVRQIKAKEIVQLRKGLGKKGEKGNRASN